MMTLFLSSVSGTVNSGNVNHNDHHHCADETSTTPDEPIISVTSADQVTGDFSATDADDDSIAEVEDRLTQIRLQKMVFADTPDSVLSASDTLSLYSGCSVNGVGEQFVAVFGGVQEPSRDKAWNEVDSINDTDSAVHVQSIDGSLCGSVNSCLDPGDQCNSGFNSTDVAGVACVQDMEIQRSNSPWCGTQFLSFLNYRCFSKIIPKPYSEKMLK